MPATTTTERPAFRAPWTAGAAAYPEADTFAAAREGFKRKRKSVMFHMTNEGEAGDQPCAYCGGLLREPALAAEKDHGKGVTSVSPAAAKADRHSTWTYYPDVKRFGRGNHYVCSWSSLLGDLHAKYRDV